MKKNVGNIDRIVRLVLALVVLILYFAHVISGALAVVLLILAGILVVTSIVSFCPLYWPLGLNTSRKKV